MPSVEGARPVLFKCTLCGFVERHEPELQARALACPSCGAKWVFHDGAWVLPVPGLEAAVEAPAHGDVVRRALDDLASWERLYGGEPGLAEIVAAIRRARRRIG